jgi:hypothetical protein
MQYQRTSSPVPDGFMEPFTPPPKAIADQDARNENQFAKFGMAKDYPEVVTYLRDKQEFYRKYLPGGSPIVGMSDAELGAWWKCATTIIEEFEAFINIVEISRDAVQQTRRG